MQMSLNNCSMYERAFSASMELISLFEGKNNSMMIVECMRVNPMLVAPIVELHNILLEVRAQDRAERTNNILQLVPSETQQEETDECRNRV